MNHPVHRRTVHTARRPLFAGLCRAVPWAVGLSLVVTCAAPLSARGVDRGDPDVSDAGHWGVTGARDVDIIVEEVLDERYQRELPGTASMPPVRRRRGEKDNWWGRGLVLAIPPGLADLFLRLVAAAAVLVMVVVVASWLFERLGPAGRRTTPVTSRGHREKDVDQAPLVRSLADAEALAGKGHFAEAIHVLLLAVVRWLNEQRDEELSAALTSREILNVLRLGGGREAALGRLIRLVEKVHFGGAPADIRLYVSCRNDYETITSLLVRTGEA